MDEKETLKGLDRYSPHEGAILAPALTLVLFVALWEVIVRVGDIHPLVLPPPSVAFKYLAFNIPLLLKHAYTTINEIVLGFLLSVVVGLILAIAMTHFSLLNKALYPLIVLSQVLPKVAFAPLLLLWLGYGILPKVVIAFTIAFFPIVINSLGGFTSVDPEMLDLFRVLQANRWQIFVKLRFKNALPQIFDGLKIAITLAVIGAIVAEFIGGDSGLGYLIIVSNSTLDTPLMFASLIVLSLAGIILFGIILLIERFSIPWNLKG